MNRKLHNTASALMVPGTLLLLALVASASDGSTQAPADPAAVAVASAALITPVADDAGAAPSGKSARASRIRHSVAMPFFSFASRG
ncbi:hypothetical protein ACFFGH_15605 [Lysobacter korlensis]|uniref:Secreted protein n=1 Tax=Lysobacter korlensis TaxID=553636 RepID=A0ABV6RR42_9GAMM